MIRLARRLPDVPGGAEQLRKVRAARKALASLTSLGEGKERDVFEEALKRDKTEFEELVAKLKAHRLEPVRVTVDALARLQLAARRHGCRVRLLNASAGLRELVAFMGLADVLTE